MLKLMVVDDETSIRRGIRHYISWDAWDIQLVAEAESAEEALQKAIHVQPDILLTDIRMGEMDGIMLTQRLKEIFPSLRVIVLSGYSDVAYLQAALKIKVDEYLLKPAGADKIIKAVLRLKEEILHERIARQKEMNRALLLDENLPIIQMHFLDGIVKGTVSDPAYIKSKAKVLGIPLDGPIYGIVLLGGIDGNQNDVYQSSQEQDMQFWQFMQRTAQAVQKTSGAFLAESADALAMILLNAETREALEQHAQRLAQQLLIELRLDARRIYVAIGQPAKTLSELKESFVGAQRALERAAWQPQQQVLMATDNQNAPLGTAYHKQEAEIASALLLGRAEQAFQALHTLFAGCRQAQADFAAVKRSCRMLCELAAYSTCPAPKDTTDFGGIEEIKNADDLEQWMESLFHRWLVPCEDLTAQYSELTRKTISYLKQHYSEDITLQMLSKIVFVSPNYLGRVFFCNTGYKLGDWLNRYRIDRAKELLISTDKKTYEIAEAVGFNSYKYFSVCFLKHAGCSARDYRSQYREVSP